MIKVYRTTIFSVVLVAHIEGERRLRVFENRVRRRIFRPKRGEGMGDWRKLNNDVLTDLYRHIILFG
jgi:hypothetical protein